GVGPGDEIIVPAMTHTATAHAVEFTGASAVFSDVDPFSGNVTAELLKAVISPATKGIIVVHMAGHCCDMQSILELCDKHNLFLIEDCAHALGTMYKGTHVGNFGVSGCFSFYPTKQIGIGEGGIVISNSKETTGFVRKMKAFGIDTPPEKRNIPGVYDVVDLGYNFRMTDYQAALAFYQLSRYKNSLSKRKENASEYCKAFSDIKGDLIEFLDFDDTASYFLFQIFLNSKYDRSELMNYFKSLDIGVSIHYATPVPMMSYYKSKYSLEESSFPNAIQYANTNISLPVHPSISSSDIYRITDSIRDFCANRT
ncbi:MAG: DegT/DnrJ/EryC1/StrS aminotransferase family protein, partial [Ekhidna sp.]